MRARSVDPDVKRPVDTADDEEQCPDILERRVDPSFFLFKGAIPSGSEGGRKKRTRKDTYLEFTSGSLCGRLAWLDFASESIVPI